MNDLRRAVARASFLGLAVATLAASGVASAADQIAIGLITKTETNPFFVKMKQGAEEAAAKGGVKLITASGKFDGDNASQVTAVENMMTAGVKAILITPSDTKAIVPTLKKARAAGVFVIALDTPAGRIHRTSRRFASPPILIANSSPRGAATLPRRTCIASGACMICCRHDI